MKTLLDQGGQRRLAKYLSQIGDVLGHDRGPIRWGNGNCQYQPCVQMGAEVLFVTIESFALALPAVPHLGVFNRYPSIFGYTLADLQALFVAGFKILLLHLCECVDVLG